jgi:glycosyltransferase involved in cell wall biosynthesis
VEQAIRKGTHGRLDRDDSPIVDVGIPTRGKSPYLDEAIESVLAQTMSRWRLVISENGPGTEIVQRLLEPYLRDPRVRHVVTGTALPVGANWTNASRGDAPYVALLHDDDRWHPEFLERRVRFLDENTSCGFVYSGQIVVDECGRALGRTNPKLPAGVYTPSEILPALFLNNFIGVPTTVVRRSAYDAVGGEYRDFVYCDHEMWLRLAARFDVGCLEVWDCEYRFHAAQTSTARASLAKEQFLAWDALPDLPIPPSLRRRAYAEAHVRCALDAVELGSSREAISELGLAIRTSLFAIPRPSIAGRMLAACAAMAGGRRGRRALTHVRSARWRTGGAEGLLPAEDLAPGSRGDAPSTPPIYVASILRPDGPTGVQTHVNAFIRYAARRRRPATLVTPFSSSRAVFYPLLAVRRPLERLSGSLGVQWYRYWHRVILQRALARVLERHDRPVVIYAQCPVSADAALRARGDRKHVVVMAVHFNVSQADEWCEKGMITADGSTYRRIVEHERRVLPQLDGIVYMSLFMQEQANERAPALRRVRSSVVPNFVSAQSPGAPLDPTTDLLCVGTLEPRKNQLYLLEILSEAEKLGHAYELTLIGDGPDRSLLERASRRLGIASRVHFRGFQPDAQSAMRSHRAVCLVSQIENFPLVLLEAMGLGVPVISTKVGGIPEMLTEGQEGVFWPLDDPVEAARILIRLLEDDDRLAAMGKAGRERVASYFTADRAGEQLLDFLSESAADASAEQPTRSISAAATA